jgi:hypothetical protein
MLRRLREFLQDIAMAQHKMPRHCFDLKALLKSYAGPHTGRATARFSAS